jgi:hypothetical protein
VILHPAVSDVDGDSLTITSATATNGTVTINADGNLAFTPDTGFLGNATIVYSVSDGNGGTASATITVVVVKPTTEIDPPVELPQSDLPDGNSLTAEGIVGLTANNARTLDGIASLQERGVVVATVNQIAKLNGMPTLAAEGEVLRTVEEANWHAWRGEVREEATEAGDDGIHLGGEVVYDATGGAEGRFIIVDAMIREGTIYVQLSDRGAPAAGDAISDYRVTLADGRALPEWLRIAQKGVLIGERPPQIESIDLAIVATTRDGQLIEEFVTIDLHTGEVKHLDEPTAGRSTGSLFSEQIMAELTQTEDEAAALLAALGTEPGLALAPQ